MEKNTGFSAPTVQPSAPLPTAPPSYEEAIAYAGALPVHSAVTSPPYPAGTAAVPMPMPCTYTF